MVIMMISNTDHLRCMEARVTIRVAPAARDVLAALDGRLFATVPEAAVVLRSDVRSVRRAIAAGDIPAQAVGPRKLVPVAWLLRAAGLETTEAGH
jgi:hypothetical protein